jgi:hypothetical protein
MILRPKVRANSGDNRFSQTKKEHVRIQDNAHGGFLTENENRELSTYSLFRKDRQPIRHFTLKSYSI